MQIIYIYESLCACLRKLTIEYIDFTHSQNIRNILTYVNNEEFRRLPVANESKIHTIYKDILAHKQVYI